MIRESLPMLKYAPLIGLISFMVTIAILIPDEKIVQQAHYLGNKLFSCPLDEQTFLNQDQTVLFDNFYDYTLYNQLLNQTNFLSHYKEQALVCSIITTIFCMYCSLLLLIDLLFP